jgi:hypothetical protein
MSAYDTLKPECANCANFDDSKHRNDPRTENAGICQKWCEVTFRNDTCNHYWNLQNPNSWDKVTAPPPPPQLNLFGL